jgi:hypothetical protein
MASYFTLAPVRLLSTLEPRVSRTVAMKQLLSLVVTYLD